MRRLILAAGCLMLVGAAAPAQTPPAANPEMRLIGATVAQHLERAEQRRARIAQLTRALAECGECPDRPAIAAERADWIERDDAIATAERAALRSIGQHTRYSSLKDMFAASARTIYATAIPDAAARQRKHDLRMIDSAITAQCGHESGYIAYDQGRPETVPGVEVAVAQQRCLAKRRPLTEEFRALLRTAIHLCAPGPLDIGTKLGAAFRERTRFETGLDYYVARHPAFFTCMYANSVTTRWCVDERKRRYDGGNALKLARHRARWGPNANMDTKEFDIRAGTEECYRITR